MSIDVSGLLKLIPRRLKHARKAANMSVKDASAAVGIPAYRLVGYERNDLPDSFMLVALCRAYGVKPSHLVGPEYPYQECTR